MYRRILCVTFSWLVLLLSSPSFAVQRAYVSALTGSDGNTAIGCPANAPCRWFAGAVTVVDPGGEVVAIDSGAYGAVTVTKSLAIISAPGAYAGITVFSGNGVTIATPGIRVVLRGLTINGLGGDKGVSMSNGDSLSIEDCVIANFWGSGKRGIFVNAPAEVFIADTTIRNSTAGISISNGANASVFGATLSGNFYGLVVSDEFSGTPMTTTAVVARSSATKGYWGFAASTNTSGNTSRLFVSDSVASYMANAGILSHTGSGGSSEVTVINSQSNNAGGGLGASGTGSKLIASGNVVTKNGNGLSQASSGVLESAVDNVVRNNLTDLSGSITTTFGKI